MSNTTAPICHVSTGSKVIPQPLPTRMPTIPTVVDLPSAIAAINLLKIIIQQLSGQTPLQGAPGTPGLNGFIPFVPATGSFNPATGQFNPVTGTFNPATGQLQPPPGAVVPANGGSGVLPIGGGGGGGLLYGSGGGVITQPSTNQKGTSPSTAAQGGRYVEDRTLRIVSKKRIFQNNDSTSENWVDIAQINRVVWVDTVTGQTIVWTR